MTERGVAARTAGGPSVASIHVTLAVACVLIGLAAAWAGPLPTLGAALAVLLIVPLVLVVGSPARALAVYAFALPLDVYVSTTLRVTTTQLLEVAILSAWLVRMLVGTRRGNGDESGPSAVPYPLVAALVAYLIISLAWSVSLDASARSVARTLAAIFMALYAAEHSDHRTLGRLTRAMCYGAVVTTIYGYFQYARGGFDPLYQYFSPFYSEPFLARGGGFAVVATFANPNILAGYMLMVLPLAWAAAAEATGLRRLGWLVTILLFAGILLLTFSKASWILLGVLIALWGLARLSIGWTLGLGTVSGMVVGVALLLLTPIIRTLLFIFPDSREASVDTRLGLWWAAVTAFLERPLLGFGMDGFAGATAAVRYGLLADLTRAHNMYLQALVDLGLIGSLLLWGTCAAIVRRGWRSLRIGADAEGSALHLALMLSAAAYFLYGLIETLNVSNQYVNTSWLVLGLLAGSSRQRAIDAALHGR
jgi:O-antigen ligase